MSDKVVRRANVRVKFIKAWKSRDEESSLREKKYTLISRLHKKRSYIADLVKKYLRDENKEKRLMVKELRDINECLSHGGLPIDQDTVLILDRASGRAWHESEDGERVRFLHNNEWVLERKLDDSEYDDDELFDNTEYDDVIDYGCKQTGCVMCDEKFETPLDRDGKSLHRYCKKCRVKIQMAG